MDAYDDTIRDQLTAQMARLEQEFKAQPAPLAANLDKKYCLKLAYAIRATVKEKGMRRLLAK